MTIETKHAERDSRVQFYNRNPSVEKGKLVVRGREVPYVSVEKVPVDENGEQVWPVAIDQGTGAATVAHEGPWRYTVTLDDRMCWDFSSLEEVEHVAGLIADAMALGMGNPSFGSDRVRDEYGDWVKPKRRH